jgi:hypothetical protein
VSRIILMKRLKKVSRIILMKRLKKNFFFPCRSTSAALPGTCGRVGPHRLPYRVHPLQRGLLVALPPQQS